MYLYCGIIVSIRNEVSEMAEKNTDRRTLKTQKALRDAMVDLLAEKELRKITEGMTWNVLTYIGDESLSGKRVGETVTLMSRSVMLLVGNKP